MIFLPRTKKKAHAMYQTIEDHVKYLHNRSSKLKGKELRKNLQQWEVALRMSSESLFLYNASVVGERVAKRQFADSIINAFKKLPR